jgi:hypothetical protein
MKGEIFLTEEMINNTNPAFIHLVRTLLSVNPKSRNSAEDILAFIEKNWEKNEELSFSKRSFDIIKKISETTAKIFKRHSTQYCKFLKQILGTKVGRPWVGTSKD